MTATGQPQTAAGGQAYILFGVAGTTYAVPSRQVQHIEMVENVTLVPNAPPFVDGVVFSRGQVIPVINLRARFGFERVRLDLRTRLLVVQHETRSVGLLADEAHEFVAIPGAAIHPPSEALGGLSGNYIEGAATLDDRIVLILDVREVVERTPTAV